MYLIRLKWIGGKMCKGWEGSIPRIPSLPNTQLASSLWVILLQASGHQGVGSNPGWVWIKPAAPQTEERCEVGRD